MKRIAVFAILVVAAALTGCNTPRYVGIGPHGVEGYRDGMTVVTPNYVVTSPPENNGSLRVNYRGGNSRGSYGRGSYKQYGSTDPDWWIR